MWKEDEFGGAEEEEKIMADSCNWFISTLFAINNAVATIIRFNFSWAQFYVLINKAISTKFHRIKSTVGELFELDSWAKTSLHGFK